MASLRISPILVFILVLACTCAFSFNASKYLYPTESVSVVTYENFTQNDSHYSIVKISGKETVFLKDDAVVKNQAEIEQKLLTYYKSKYYPTQTELDSLVTLLKTYNKSRTDGAGEEEMGCMRDMLKVDGSIVIDNTPLRCTNDSSCEFAALFMYKKWYYGLFQDEKAYLAMMKPFAFASDGNSEIINTAISKLSNVNENNIYDALNYVKTSIPTLKANKDTIEKSDLIITPQYAICPPVQFNTTALDALETQSNALTSKTLPLSEYKGISKYIADSTTEREAFHTSENKAKYYSGIFAPLYNNSKETMKNANDLSKKINNNSIKVKVDLLSQLTEKINKSITNKNFTSIDSDIDDYKKLIDSTNAAIGSTKAYYQLSLDKKGEENALLVIVTSKGGSTSEEEKIAEITNKTNALDNKFDVNVKSEDHAGYIANYSKLTDELKEIYKMQKEAPLAIATNNFKLASYRAADTVFDTMETTKLVPSDQIKTNKTYILAGFAAVIFISLASTVGLFIATRISRKKITTLRAALYGVVSIGMIVVFLLFSIGLYYFMNKATTISDVELWLDSFDKSDKNVSIVLNLANTTEDSKTAMKDCAKFLSSAIEARPSKNNFNKSTSIYQMNDGKCFIGLGTNVTANKSECLKAMNTTETITFKYNAVNGTISIPAVLEKEVSVNGNAKWYNTCVIAAIFKNY